MTEKAIEAVERARPVAWRWRYMREGSHWTLRGTPIEAQEPALGLVGIEVEALYTRAAVLASQDGRE